MKSGAQIVVEHLLGKKKAARVYARLLKTKGKRSYIRTPFKVRYFEDAFHHPVKPGLIFSYRLKGDYHREARLTPKGWSWQGNPADFIWLGLAFMLLKTKRIQQTAMRTGGCVVIKSIAKTWREKEVKTPMAKKKKKSSGTAKRHPVKSGHKARKKIQVVPSPQPEATPPIAQTA